MRFLLGDQNTKICRDEQNNYPLAAAAGKDFYVDDILSGTEDLSSAIELQDQLIHLLKSADRHVLCSEALKVDLIGFGDASKNAYGCAVYTRSLSRSGKMKVALLCSKSRVAPIKEISIPRLELCAADLLSKLTVKVLSSLQLNIHGVHLYSDSTVVLAWIKTPPTSLKTFVANRVTRIQEYTKNFQWHYVNTAENPADLISQGAFSFKDPTFGHLVEWTIFSFI
ncbi:uncharacterized protein LOC129959783 [Argiope bruennichi]|uniref:uncharacterized protein LOC129959783 n=1 Tax=Argiope bruennichi TaxID=94029 RepID=UPI0024945E36|nr:uncharacterized protein LOC129959783 [Argiope bruennichi]